MNVSGNIRGWRCLASVALAGGVLSAAAQAAPDRDNTTPTGWWWLSNALATDIQDRVNDGWRPIDLEPIAGTSPQRFVAAFVADNGEYDKAFWWDDNATEAGVNSVLGSNNARLIDIEPYEVGGVIRYAYVAIANSGQDFSPANWWIAGRTEQEVRDFATANNARIIDADYYVEGGTTQYAAVLVPDSGAWAKGHWWLPDATPTEIANELTLRGARVVSIERQGLGTYNALLESTAGISAHWWYWGITEDGLNFETRQNKSRIVQADRYVDGNGDTRYVAALVDNGNEAEQTAREALGEALDQGYYGMYIKQVNGPVLASILHDEIYEPASALKIVHHMTAHLDIFNNPFTTTTLATPVTYLGTNYDSCVDPSDPVVTQLPMSQILSLMMNNSDNEATWSVTQFYSGFAALNATAANLNMTDTLIRHHIGCPTAATSNMTTLVDLGRIYQAFANNILSPAGTASFRNLMQNTVGGSLNQVIDEEAADAGMPAFIENLFRAQTRFIGKGGNYGYGNGLADRTGFGMAELPFKSRCELVPIEFVFGSYYNKCTETAATQAALGTANRAALKEPVRAAIDSWMSQCLADLTLDGGVDADDIFVFLDLWFAGEADMDNDGRISADDIFRYLELWFRSI